MTDIIEEEHMMKTALKVFVYGTLKKGDRDHDRVSEGVVSIEQATVRGRLFDLPVGDPALDVPGMDILAVGTIDPAADLDTQYRFINPSRVPLSSDFGEWKEIEGELLTFEDAAWLDVLDRVRGFSPYFFSNHKRVLLPVTTADGKVTTAWCYLIGEFLTSCASPSDETSWS
jgi:gamma-glutamylcyclotransferase (GGCT)/AIG2-like uncharacterized protein YtfP